MEGTTNGVHIFVAEDNPADVLLIRDALEQASIDCSLRCFSDGEQIIEAVDELERTPDLRVPDLLLLDLNLPRYAGQEVLTKIRAGTRCPGLPVVVLTSSDSPRDREQASQLQVAHYFRKPSDYDQFMQLGQVVRTILLR
jgi:CheY-like chemotaxis protein